MLVTAAGIVLAMTTPALPQAKAAPAAPAPPSIGSKPVSAASPPAAAGSKPVPVPATANGASPAAPAVAKPEEPKEPSFTYQPRGRRDPFTPLIIAEEKKAPVANRPPLQRYNITDFKFTGVVWGGLGYNAILEAPDGKGYFIRVGTLVGPNGGVVKKITQSALVIEEKYKTFSGETHRKEIVVELRRKQEGTP